MSNVGTLLDGNKALMGEFGQDILDLASKVPVPVGELAEALYDVVSATGDTSNAMAILKESAELGKAGIGSTAEATNLLTTAMNAFKGEGLSSADIADTLF